MNESTQTAIFHRWGDNDQGQLERFVVVLNFTDNTQWINVPFPDNGDWTDLLNENTVAKVGNYWLPNYPIPFELGPIRTKFRVPSDAAIGSKNMERKLMAVPENEIFRSIGPEEFCGFRFFFGRPRIRYRRNVMEDEPSPPRCLRMVDPRSSQAGFSSFEQ